MKGKRGCIVKCDCRYMLDDSSLFQAAFGREMNVAWEILTVSCAVMFGPGNSKCLTIFSQLEYCSVLYTYCWQFAKYIAKGSIPTI